MEDDIAIKFLQSCLKDGVYYLSLDKCKAIVKHIFSEVGECSIDYLDSGSFGVILKYNNPRQFKKGAVKVIVGNICNENSMKEAKDEIDIQININNPYIAKVKGFTKIVLDKNIIIGFIWMQYYEGRFNNQLFNQPFKRGHNSLNCIKDGSLKMFLDKLREQKQELDLKTKMRLGIQLFDALASMHQKNIFHRNIKAANILMYQGDCAIADFGISRIQNIEQQISNSIEIKVTPIFLDPEIHSGKLDKKMDLFAMGIILLMMDNVIKFAYESHVYTHMIDNYRYYNSSFAKNEIIQELREKLNTNTIFFLIAERLITTKVRQRPTAEECLDLLKEEQSRLNLFPTQVYFTKKQEYNKVIYHCCSSDSDSDSSYGDDDVNSLSSSDGIARKLLESYLKDGVDYMQLEKCKAIVKHISSEVGKCSIDYLDSGSFGVVLKFYNPRQFKKGAVKVIVGSIYNENSMKEVKDDLDIQINISNPYIAKVKGYTKVVLDKNFIIGFIWMQYYEDGSLKRFLDKLREQKQEMEIKTKMRLGIQLFDALASMHQKNVFHTNIKASNILMNDGDCAIADFGESIIQNIDQQISNSILQKQDYFNKQNILFYKNLQKIKGTPMFQDPEIHSGKLDKKMDLFAMGIILLMMDNVIKFAYESHVYSHMIDNYRYYNSSFAKNEIIQELREKLNTNTIFFQIAERLITTKVRQRLTAEECLDLLKEEESRLNLFPTQVYSTKKYRQSRVIEKYDESVLDEQGDKQIIHQQMAEENFDIAEEFKDINCVESQYSFYSSRIKIKNQNFQYDSQSQSSLLNSFKGNDYQIDLNNSVDSSLTEFYKSQEHSLSIPKVMDSGELQSQEFKDIIQPLDNFSEMQMLSLQLFKFDQITKKDIELLVKSCLKMKNLKSFKLNLHEINSMRLHIKELSRSIQNMSFLRFLNLGFNNSEIGNEIEFLIGALPLNLQKLRLYLKKIICEFEQKRTYCQSIKNILMNTQCDIDLGQGPY
ncbi:hypothetical protein ABPG72_013675 [Tetrahymena utriculariae]